MSFHIRSILYRTNEYGLHRFLAIIYGVFVVSFFGEADGDVAVEDGSEFFVSEWSIPEGLLIARDGFLVVLMFEVLGSLCLKVLGEGLVLFQ
jgi:hypothetical protein